MKGSGVESFAAVGSKPPIVSIWRLPITLQVFPKREAVDSIARNQRNAGRERT